MTPLGRDGDDGRSQHPSWQRAASAPQAPSARAAATVNHLLPAGTGQQPGDNGQRQRAALPGPYVALLPLTVISTMLGAPRAMREGEVRRVRRRRDPGPSRTQFPDGVWLGLMASAAEARLALGAAR